MSLLAQTELGDQITISNRVFVLEVGQQTLATINHHDQTAAGVVILGVRFEVTVEFVDTGGQKRDLHFRGTRIVLAARIIRDNGSLAGFFHRHDYYLSHAVRRVITPHTVNNRLNGRIGQKAEYTGNAPAIQPAIKYGQQITVAG